MAKPEMIWADLVVGEEFGPFVYEMTAERVAAYRDVTGDHEVETVDGEAVAPPTILTFPMLNLGGSKYRGKPGGIHARQVFEVLAPVRVGATLTVTGMLSEMRITRGRKYHTIECAVVDERGVLVARGETTGIYPDIDLGGDRG